MTNEEIVKAISMSNLANGELNPEQQKKFMNMVYDNTKLLNEARREDVDNPKGELSKLFIGEPITRGAPASGSEPSAGEATPKTTKLEYSTNKLVTYYDLPTDVLFRNIEQENFEDTFMEAVSTRVGNDIEMLAIQGNVSAYGSVNTPIGYLLRELNGWLYQSASAHVVDAAAASIAKGFFAKMYRQLPDQYKGDPNLRWIMSETVKADWLDVVSDRLTVAGDEALKGNGLSPYGIPILSVPLIPNNLSVSIDAATSGSTVGSRMGPFEFTSSAKNIKVDVDNAGAVEFSFTEGTLETTQVAAEINAALGANIARDAGWGQIALVSPTTGASSEIDVQTPAANDANAILGLTVGVYAGSDSGTAGTMYEGSRIMLSNPKNFITVALKNTRVYSEFKPRKDALEVTMYNEVDVLIENLEALVFGTNVRLRQL